MWIWMVLGFMFVLLMLGMLFLLAFMAVLPDLERINQINTWNDNV